MDTNGALDAHATELAAEWFRSQSRNLYGQYHLWYRDSRELDLEPDAISYPTVAECKPGPDWELATGERISPAWTETQARRWIRKQMQRLPILSTA